MPFDGMFLYTVCRPLRDAVGAKADKIFQPCPDELVLVLRGSAFSGRLLISADPAAPRLYITKLRPDNPPQAPAFCMLLRKALAGARLTGVHQAGLDRFVAFDFEAVNEMGDTVTRSLNVELMGRCANVILTEGGRILDALRRVDFSMSASRQILPGGHYEPPAPQDKLAPDEIDAARLSQAMSDAGQAQLKTALLSLISGLSPLLARELCVRAGYAPDVRACDADAARVLATLGWLSKALRGEPQYTALYDGIKGGFEFSFTDIMQYDGYAEKKSCPDAGDLLDGFYAERTRAAVVRSRGADLRKAVRSHTTRLTRRIESQRGELEATKQCEEWKNAGDLITANIYRIKPGDSLLRAPDYTLPDAPEQTVELDPTLSPAANAQRFYKRYRKARTAAEHLSEQLEKGAAELEYLASVTEELSRAATGGELAAIRAELVETGYLRAQRAGKGGRAKKQPLPRTEPHRFSYNGVEILAGRNNLQNDMLTHKTALKNEWWLHALGSPGSHVIVRSPEADEATLAFAARIAALYSAGEEGGKTAVDMTRVRYVKKLPSAAPGMVTYTNQTTLYVTPDAAEAEAHRV